MLLSMLLFLLSNAWFWRSTDHYMRKKSVHACGQEDGPEPERVLSDHNTQRHIPAPDPSLSLFALLHRQQPDPVAPPLSCHRTCRISSDIG